MPDFYTFRIDGNSTLLSEWLSVIIAGSHHYVIKDFRDAVI